MTINNKCPICIEQGSEVDLIQIRDEFTCPKCKSTIRNRNLSPLKRYQQNWTEHSEEIYPFLRPPLDNFDISNIRLLYLYEDCYNSMLIGRFNVSIVMMGVFLEAIMKERIWLKSGKEHRGAYESCLKKLETKKWMKMEDIIFLRMIKNKFRNPYQHSDEYTIMKGQKSRVIPLRFEGEFNTENFKEMMNRVRSGEHRPKVVPAEVKSPIRVLAKQSGDRSKAIHLFNTVHDFLLTSLIRYFKREVYEEHHKEFGSPFDSLEHIIV